MFRSAKTIFRPICESCFYDCWLHIGIPLCLQIMPVCMPAMSTLNWGVEQWVVSELCVGVAEYIKLGGGTVGSIRTLRGCCVSF